MLADTDGSTEAWDIDIAIDLIAEFRFQPAELNVEVIVDNNSDRQTVIGLLIIKRQCSKRAKRKSKK